MADLSPAAQVVYDAIKSQDVFPSDVAVAVAAIRAVADQVVPVMTTAEGARIYNSIEAIAAELEATS